MEDFSIELLPDEGEENLPIQLPSNFLTIGEIENDDIKVYIKQSVYNELEKYASSDTAHELGTVILGGYTETLGKMHVIISDFIYAKYTDASASTLTFTHKTWEYIHKVHDDMYQDKKIVGWQHTHPGYGIFLSNYDMFIQENFFNLPFQVAYVIDPIQHIRGFFQWKNGRVEKLKGFYIYDDIGKVIKIEQEVAEKTNTKYHNTEIRNGKQHKIHNVLIMALSVLTICLLMSVFVLYQKYTEQVKKQRLLEEKIEDQRILLLDYAEEIGSISKKIQNNGEYEDIAPYKEEIHDEKDLSENEDNEGLSIVEKNGGENNKRIPSEIVLISHIIEEGDSLIGICEKNDIDYYSNYRIILSINGIEDANQIYIGQTVLLPIEDK